MDLVQTIRKEGSRGGRGEFKWDDVKLDTQRENYLGHSLMAPVGRWQKGKDLNWYAKGDAEAEAEKSEADRRKAEIRKIKEAEEDAMAAALGLPPPARHNANLAPLGKNRIQGPASRLREASEERDNRRDHEDRHKRQRDDDRYRRGYRYNDDESRREDRHKHHGRRSRSPDDRKTHRRRDHTERRYDSRERDQRTRVWSRSPNRVRNDRDTNRRRYRSRSPSKTRRLNRSPGTSWRKRRSRELDSDSQGTSPTSSPRRGERPRNDLETHREERRRRR